MAGLKRSVKQRILSIDSPKFHRFTLIEGFHPIQNETEAIG
jgi:hypothetical protein